VRNITDRRHNLHPWPVNPGRTIEATDQSFPRFAVSWVMMMLLPLQPMMVVTNELKYRYKLRRI